MAKLVSDLPGVISVEGTILAKPSGRLKDSIEGRKWLREVEGVRTSGASRKKPGSKRYSKGRSKYMKREFICWDGEGITVDNNVHNYILLANSLGETLEANSPNETLHTVHCFDFFLKCKKDNPNAIHCFFAAGYDFNMILRSLSWHHLQRLYDTGRCYWGDYSITLRPGKFLRIKVKGEPGAVILYDVFGFFQMSFVKALQTWEVTDESLDNIIAQKSNRSVFDWSQREDIKVYCLQELSAMVKLMIALRESLAETGTNLDRWDGTGAIAGKWFTTHNTKSFHGAIPSGVNEAAQYAYAGGRIDCHRYGNHVGKVYYYDVNSAYPAAMAKLPNLANSRWFVDKGTSVLPFSLYHVTYQNLPSSFYPSFYRTPIGLIHYPQSATNWLWSPDYEALVSSGATVKVLRRFRFVPHTDELPFDWINETYATRKQWKVEGRSAEKALKLGLNSLYGKTIQQKGWTKERGIPPHHQLEWGGYITSVTRAKLYKAAMLNPDSVIGFETDGLITTEPLPLELDDELGGWGCDEYDGITYIQPGIYWLLSGGNWLPKYRGFDKDSLTRGRVIEGWRKGAPSVEVHSTRFQTLGYSLVSTSRKDDWCKWITAPRKLSIYDGGNKRLTDWANSPRTPAEGLMRTEVYASVRPSDHSTKYPLVWKGETNADPAATEVEKEYAECPVRFEDYNE